MPTRRVVAILAMLLVPALARAAPPLNVEIGLTEVPNEAGFYYATITITNPGPASFTGGIQMNLKTFDGAIFTGKSEYLPQYMKITCSHPESGDRFCASLDSTSLVLSASQSTQVRTKVKAPSPLPPQMRFTVSYEIKQGAMTFPREEKTATLETVRGPRLTLTTRHVESEMKILPDGRMTTLIEFTVENKGTAPTRGDVRVYWAMKSKNRHQFDFAPAAAKGWEFVTGLANVFVRSQPIPEFGLSIIPLPVMISEIDDRGGEIELTAHVMGGGSPDAHAVPLKIKIAPKAFRPLPSPAPATLSGRRR